MITRKQCEEYANEHNLVLSQYADKILTRTVTNDGYCPCVSAAEREAHPENDYQCPCSLCLGDVAKSGHCHCHLFLAKE